MSDLETLPNLPDSGGGAETEQAMRLLRLIWRGKWILLLVPLLFGGLTFAYYSNTLGKVIPQLKVVSRYRANSKILIQVKGEDPVTGLPVQTTAPSKLLKQQEGLFGTESMLKPLSEIPEIQQLQSLRRQKNKSIAAALAEHLKARVDDSQDRLSVTFESPRKEDAILVVDKAVEVFRQHLARANRLKAQRSIEIVTKERDEADEALDRLEKEWTAKRAEYGVTGQASSNPFQPEVERLADSVRDAKAKQTTAQVELEEAEANTSTPERAQAFGERLRIERSKPVLEAEIEQYQAEKQKKLVLVPELLVKYSEDSEPVLNLRAEIDTLSGLIAEIYERYAESELIGLQSEVDASTAVLARFEQELEAAEKKFFAMEEGLSELRRLGEEREMIAEDRRLFAERIADLSVTQESDGLYTEIVERARVAKKPVYPEVQTFTLYGLVAGVLLACGIVALRGLTDRRVWSPEEVPGMLGTSVVGVLPAMSSKKSDKVGQVVQAEPGSLAAEAVRSVRTATTFALGEDGRGIVLMTSSVSGEGKSISSSNLALAFAQSGRKTLLVDADLRKPGQNAIFNLIGKRGLGDAIQGDVSWQSAIVQKVVGDLDLLPAGAADKGPAELLESSACRAVFAELRREYDVIVVDSSPVLETAETRFLSTLADVCLFVMRIDLSTAPNARRAVGILQSVGANLIGVFLNGASRRRGAKTYAEGISYGYGYGYGGGYGNANRADEGAPPPPRKRAPEDTSEAWS